MDYTIFLFATILITVSIVLLVLYKDFVLNSILGALGFLICYFILGVKLPILATILLSAIFGLAGLGIMVILWFFGLV